PAGKVEQSDSPELADDGLAPGFQHLGHGHVVCHGENEIEVRPTISFVVRERTKDRSSDDTSVRRRHAHYPIPKAVTVLDAEHVSDSGPRAQVRPTLRLIRHARALKIGSLAHESESQPWIAQSHRPHLLGRF